MTKETTISKIGDKIIELEEQGVLIYDEERKIYAYKENNRSKAGHH